MTTLSEIRDGLAANLLTTGVRSGATVPDNPTPPLAYVGIQNIQYDGAMQGGLTTYNMIVSVIVSRLDERSGQDVS